MKVFVIFALFVVAINAGRKVNLCRKAGADLGESEEWKTNILWGANQIFGHCHSVDLPSLLFGDSSKCLPLFNQAFCYGQLAYAHYSELSTVISYGDLADAIPDIQQLGKYSCSYVRPCYNSLREAFKVCKSEAGFIEGVVDAVEDMYRQYGEDVVERLGNDKSNKLLSELITIVRKEFTSVKDIRKAVDEYLSDEIISDAEIALSEFDIAAVEWCNDNCPVKSGRFIKNLFTYMNASATCNDASKYCGECQTRAEEYLVRPVNAIPCCLDTVIQKSVEGVAYLQEAYKEMIADFQDYLKEKLSDEAVTVGLEIKNRVLDELNCLDDSYEKTTNTCTEA